MDKIEQSNLAFELEAIRETVESLLGAIQAELGKLEFLGKQLRETKG